MASACKEVGAHFVTISTDYVFSGRKGSLYTEDDECDPVNVYGRSKRCGEVLALSTYERTLVCRVSALFGLSRCRAKGGKNFVDVMVMKLIGRNVVEVVNDQTVSPTYASDCAHRILELIRLGTTGVVHVTNSGFCTWYEFASEIQRQLAKRRDVGRVVPKTTRFEVGRAQRPRFSAMTSTRMPAMGLPLLRSWREALRSYLVLKEV